MKCDSQLGGVYKVVRGAMSDTKGLKIIQDAATLSTPDARVRLLEGYDFRYFVEEEEEEDFNNGDIVEHLQTAMHNIGFLTAALFWGSVDEEGVRRRHIRAVVGRISGSVDGFTWLRDIEVSRLYIC